MPIVRRLTVTVHHSDKTFIWKFIWNFPDFLVYTTKSARPSTLMDSSFNIQSKMYFIFPHWLACLILSSYFFFSILPIMECPRGFRITPSALVYQNISSHGPIQSFSFKFHNDWQIYWVLTQFNNSWGKRNHFL